MLNSPAAILLCTHWWLGLKRRVWPHIATRPVFFCSATTASAPASESASGISTCTCLPAFRQAIVCSACICVGVHRITASTSFSARLSARSVRDVARCRTWRRPPCVLSSSRLTSETTSTPSISLIASRCLMPKAPAPASATLIVIVGSPGSDGRRPCCWRARGRSGASTVGGLPPATSAIAPRAISHITSSMPSLPASRTYSMCGTFDSPSGSAIRRSRKWLSHSALISPARGPCSWWLMPPVPQICTFSGSS